MLHIVLEDIANELFVLVLSLCHRCAPQLWCDGCTQAGLKADLQADSPMPCSTTAALPSSRSGELHCAGQVLGRLKRGEQR